MSEIANGDVNNNSSQTTFISSPLREAQSLKSFLSQVNPPIIFQYTAPQTPEGACTEVEKEEDEHKSLDL